MSETQNVQTNNYTIGRGRLYFNMFSPGTLTPTGELYFGNTPSCETTQATTDLKHYSSESGLKVQDAAVTLQKDITVQFACDNIAVPNLALWLGAVSSASTQAAGTTATEDFDVVGNYFYQVGATSANPMGVSDLASMTAQATIAIAATGTITFTAQPAVADTVTIEGTAISFVASSTTPVGAQVQLGGNFAGTAQNLATYINADSELLEVTASGGAAVLTITANVPGTSGNAITLAKSSANITLSGATLSGGSAGATAALTEGVDWLVDLQGGRFQIIEGGGAVDGSVVAVTYTTAASATSLVITNEMDVYGSLRFVSDNPVGENSDYYWPYVNLRSSGAMQLKGDNWQEMTFAAEVLKLQNMQRVYVRRRPGGGEGS